MTVELLQEAAVLMRQRAEAASEGEWLAVSDNNRKSGIALVGIKSLRGQGELGCLAVLAGTPRAGTVAERHHNAEHIASWHPAVAVAVADWLEITAKDVGTSSWSFHSAVVVARTYLGRAV